MFDISVFTPKFRPSTSTEIAVGRFEVSATVGHETVITYAGDLLLAKTVLREGLERPYADNDDAHGRIYDRRSFRTVHSWRGGDRTPPVNPIIAMFERAISSGAKVMLATPAGVTHFDGGLAL